MLFTYCPAPPNYHLLTIPATATATMAANFLKSLPTKNNSSFTGAVASTIYSAALDYSHPQFSDWRHFAGVEVSEGKCHLLYKPYMDFLCETLLQFVPGLEVMPLSADIELKLSRKGARKAQVLSWLLCGERLRRIRMTYFDAGAAGQAFNSLIYPHYCFDLPLLGIDLLSFGSSKILCVVDFQPISKDADSLERHTKQLVPLYNSFAGSCSRMSTRYFDENQFFSKHLIFFRSSIGKKDPHLQVPDGEFYQVYMGYVKNYFRQLQELKANYDDNFMAEVQRGQAAYDQYFFENDPAIGIFGNYFGHEWSKQYAEEFLFPESKIAFL